jgi:PTS system nitrogen regulatory IIA component
MKIFSYLNEQLIFLLDAPSKEEVLQTMVSKTIEVRKLPEGEKFYQAILNREEIVSTGIGMGVAIPHAKLQSFKDFFISLGVLKKGVDWNAFDNAPVRLVFLIGGPDDRQTEYLKILSALTVALRDEELRKLLISTTTAHEVLKLFEDL